MIPRVTRLLLRSREVKYVAGKHQPPLSFDGLANGLLRPALLRRTAYSIGHCGYCPRAGALMSRPIYVAL
jgi:hypothetical protein